MLEIIWGLKVVACMDVWTIEHVLSGISVGHAVKNKNNNVLERKFGIGLEREKIKYFDYIGVLFLAYLWETIEHYLEIGIAGNAVEYWFQGVEYWPNRIIFDPLMLIIGYHIAKKHPRLVTKARIISIIWLFVHIFIFPHSMYLHEII